MQDLDCRSQETNTVVACCNNLVTTVNSDAVDKIHRSLSIKLQVFDKDNADIEALATECISIDQYLIEHLTETEKRAFIEFLSLMAMKETYDYSSSQIESELGLPYGSLYISLKECYDFLSQLMTVMNYSEAITQIPSDPVNYKNKLKRYHVFCKRLKNKELDLEKEIANRSSSKELALNAIELDESFLDLSNRFRRLPRERALDFLNEIFQVVTTVVSPEFNELLVSLEFKLDDEAFLRRYNEEMRRVVNLLFDIIQNANQNASSAVDSSDEIQKANQNACCHCAIL